MNHDRQLDAEAGEDASARLVGTRVGKYEIVRIVGKGGMGCVYEALNTSIQKRVAMKCIDHELAKNEEAYERFHREALAASAIESPHIVQIFDAGKTEAGVPFIVMELLRGMDLGGYLKRVGRLDVNDALHIAIHVLKGLHHAHGSGIVHRDLKPDNVFLVDRDEEPVFVKLLDFGVSKISRITDVPLETLTRQGTVVGTPFYMSPEQAQAFPDVDHRTDIYSVGALVFECLAGRTVHVGKSYEQVIVNICMKDVDDVRTHNPGVPAGVAAVIHKALAREPEDRYQNAREMLNALVDGAPDSFRQGTPSSKLRGVSLGGLEGGIAHTPMVISPKPGTHIASGLADTVQTDSADDLESADLDAKKLGESGVTAKAGTLPSDGGEAAQPVTAEPVTAQPAQSVSAPSVIGDAPRRRWALAAAPGVALLLGLALYVSFGAKQEADVISNSVEESVEQPPSDSLQEAEPLPAEPKAAAVAADAPLPAATASASAVAEAKPAAPPAWKAPVPAQVQATRPAQPPATAKDPPVDPPPQQIQQKPPELELQLPQ